MRSVVPEPGMDFVRIIRVDLEPGDSIPQHAHDEHTVLYYPADAGPIVITPTAGVIIYVPPGTPHEVPKVDATRISVAMLVEPQK